MFVLKILKVNSMPLNLIYNGKSNDKHCCALAYAGAGKTLFAKLPKVRSSRSGFSY
jgi:hypothetical protein